jgi:CheY-like chemotaxis protein
MSIENRLRVLMVDDVIDAADTVALLLKRWGYDVAVCYDGAKAVEAARTYQPHVALLDIAMPRMDGFQVARRLRALPELRQTILVAVTGYADAASRHRGERAGFDHYFAKPMEPSQLQELLVRVADQQRLVRVPQPDGGGWQGPHEECHDASHLPTATSHRAHDFRARDSSLLRVVLELVRDRGRAPRQGARIGPWVSGDWA